MDLLFKSLSGIKDEGSLANLAGGFNHRAELLAVDGSAEALAWRQVFSVLALMTESALLERRTGVIL